MTADGGLKPARTWYILSKIIDIGITPMMRIQLGGVFAKEKHSASPKLTGSARYRGTKVDRTPQTSGQFGWHRENIKALLVP
ncbi:hypothetical protein YDYSY3_56520 [Paenibacillus chitinolyticus]|uniref:hypothetical protein n=1 Tax=Paenibacillus chitinolyticus TaxID=79263 RepID=UPI0026E4D938|nr:hypothetical protein [Paenibacillus chitinolyticus]GKS14652.1 hypothetical protein YDYSY3_56520 [Paenibacillus chitinolyticus]